MQTIIGSGLEAEQHYEDTLKTAGYPQAASWVLGTMGGLLAGRYGLGPMLHEPMDVIIPDSMADEGIRHQVGDLTGAFVGGNLGAHVGYTLAGQRAPLQTPAEALRAAAGMDPTGHYEHPEEFDVTKRTRKTAGIGAGIKDFAETVPTFAGWLAPTMGGILAGSIAGDAIGPHLSGLTPEGTPEAGTHIGRVAGGILGGIGGSALGYKLVGKEEAPDMTPLGVTSVAAGADVPSVAPATVPQKA